MHIFTYSFTSSLVFWCIPSMCFLVNRLKYMFCFVFSSLYFLSLSVVSLRERGLCWIYRCLCVVLLCTGKDTQTWYSNNQIIFLALTLLDIKSRKAQLKCGIRCKCSDPEDTELDSSILIIKKILWFNSYVSCSQNFTLCSAMSGLFSA